MSSSENLDQTVPTHNKKGPSPIWLAGFIVVAVLFACSGIFYWGWKSFSVEPPQITFDDLVLTLTSAPESSTHPPVTTVQSTVSPLAPTLVPTLTVTPDPAIPTGKIAYVCQLFKSQASDQICIMKADGSEQRRLTTRDDVRHFYPSMSPDGQSVVFTSNMSGTKDPLGNVYYDIYEQNIFTGEITQLTSELGIITAPEISPDGSQIVFKNSDGRLNDIWLMGRDGSDPHKIYGSAEAQGWDPIWSPDGSQILFAGYDQYFAVQLYIMDADGSNVRQVTQMTGLRGRNDWSPQGNIVTYAGQPWNREVYIMRTDGSELHQLTPAGGNSQGPSFSPDGNWVTFTAYFDRYGDDNGCEIYIIRVDGTDLRRLTDNTYCDWQPRWGP